jgi:hypothetical protein
VRLPGKKADVGLQVHEEHFDLFEYFLCQDKKYEREKIKEALP